MFLCRAIALTLPPERSSAMLPLIALAENPYNLRFAESPKMTRFIPSHFQFSQMHPRRNLLTSACSSRYSNAKMDWSNHEPCTNVLSGALLTVHRQQFMDWR